MKKDIHITKAKNGYLIVQDSGYGFEHITYVADSIASLLFVIKQILTNEESQKDE